MPAAWPHTFTDGPGNTASGEEVMDNLDYVYDIAVAGGGGAPVGGPGTSLPGTPEDDEEYLYIADAGLGVIWHMKYDTGSGKWRCIGGPPIIKEVTAAVATTSTAYGALTASAGPSIAVPKSGLYYVTIGALITEQLGEGEPIMSYDIGATPAVDADGISKLGMPMGVRPKTLGAVTLTSKYKVPTTGGIDTPGGTFARRTMSLQVVTMN